MALKTNVERVVEFMEANPLHQMYVISALDNITDFITKNPDMIRKDWDNGFIHVESWIKAAESWDKTRIEAERQAGITQPIFEDDDEVDDDSDGQPDYHPC